VQRVSGETEVKQCIPSPSMLHLICCIREENYQPIERYQDNDVLLKDIAYAYQKAIKAFYNAGGIRHKTQLSLLEAISKDYALYLSVAVSGQSCKRITALRH